MVAPVDARRRVVTPAEVEAMLPLLTRIVEDLVREFRDLRRYGGRRRRLKLDGDGARWPGRLAGLRRLIDGRTAAIADHMREVEALGGELIDLERGLVRFAAWVQDAPAFVYWSAPETRMWWRLASDGEGTRRAAP